MIDLQLFKNVIAEGRHNSDLLDSYSRQSTIILRYLLIGFYNQLYILVNLLDFCNQQQKHLYQIDFYNQQKIMSERCCILCQRKILKQNVSYSNLNNCYAM